MLVSSAFRVRSKIPEGIVKNSLASVLLCRFKIALKIRLIPSNGPKSQRNCFSLFLLFFLSSLRWFSDLKPLMHTHTRSRQLHFREIGAALRPCKKGELRFQILIYLSLFIFSFSLLSEIKCLDVIEGFVFLPQTHFSHF